MEEQRLYQLCPVVPALQWKQKAGGAKWGAVPVNIPATWEVPCVAAVEKPLLVSVLSGTSSGK